MARRRGLPLSATFVKGVRQPGRYGDGGRGSFGLYLRVYRRANGRTGKSWGQRVTISGRITNLGLGTYPVVTLAEAREKALHNLREIAAGRNPRGGGIPPFAKAAEKVIRLHRKEWKGDATEKQWRSSLARYVHPYIGEKPVSKITVADVMSVLVPIWHEKRVTAQRIRNRISAVMKWSIAQGYRQDDPAGDAIAAALPRNGRRTVHHAALPHAEVGKALKTIRGSKAPRSLALAIELLAHTGTRSGEVRGATWEEFDMETAVWTIPANRMKSGVEHRVPLSTHALAILNEARRQCMTSRLVFFGERRRGMLGAQRFNDLFRQLAIPGTPHGLRSSLRDWCSERGIRRPVAERALAHAVRDRTEAAYHHTDLLQERREVMQAWSDYLNNGEGVTNIAL